MTDEECNSDETGGIEKTGVTYGRHLEGCVITYGGQFVVHFTRQTFHCVNLLPCFECFSEMRFSNQNQCDQAAM